jgi:hypothetical protein
MKTKITPAFVIICITMLIAAYGISMGIKEINIYRIETAKNKLLSKEIQNMLTISPGEEKQSQQPSYTQNMMKQGNTQVLGNIKHSQSIDNPDATENKDIIVLKGTE